VTEKIRIQREKAELNRKRAIAKARSDKIKAEKLKVEEE
jgi:hypothetical protein